MKTLRNLAVAIFTVGLVVLVVSWHNAHEGQHDHAEAAPNWPVVLIIWAVAFVTFLAAMIARSIEQQQRAS